MCLCAWGSRKKKKLRLGANLAEAQVWPFALVRRGRLIELGMKIAVRRVGLEHIGVVIRLEGEHVVVRWTQSKWPEELEYLAHRDDVEPIDGWV